MNLETFLHSTSTLISHIEYSGHHTTTYVSPSSTATTCETDFTLGSYGITLTLHHPPSPPLQCFSLWGGCRGKKEGFPLGLMSLPLRTCGLGIIGLQLQQPSSKLALIWRMTPFTFVWLPAASTAAAFILHSGSGFYCMDLAESLEQAGGARGTQSQH